jgi:hypothetical protein
VIAAQAPDLVRIPLERASRPAGWGRERHGLTMKRPGRLYATFRVPTSGRWELWVQGQIMPTVEFSLDGRPLASIGGQLSGNSLVPDTVPPLQVMLSAGAHRLSVTRPGLTLAPGGGGSAVLDAIFLTPAGAGAQDTLRRATASSWRSLCGREYEWVEIVGART